MAPFHCDVLAFSYSFESAGPAALVVPGEQRVGVEVDRVADLVDLAGVVQRHDVLEVVHVGLERRSSVAWFRSGAIGVPPGSYGVQGAGVHCTTRMTMPLPQLPTQLPLTRDRIVEEAMALVDEEGPDALSMRRLAVRLGTSTMSTYHHLPDKRSLLEAIAEQVMAELETPDDDVAMGRGPPPDVVVVPVTHPTSSQRLPVAPGRLTARRAAAHRGRGIAAIATGFRPSTRCSSSAPSSDTCSA